MEELKNDIEVKYLKEFELGHTKLSYEQWLKNKISIYTEELNKQALKNNKERQEFQLGDIAYMIDEDYRFFESEVYKIEFSDGKYYYETHDCDFESKDIDDWVFKSEMYREFHLM